MPGSQRIAAALFASASSVRAPSVPGVSVRALTVLSFSLSLFVTGLTGCSDHDSALERARGESGEPGKGPVVNETPIGGVPTTPNAGTPPILPAGTPGTPGTPPAPTGCQPQPLSGTPPAWHPPAQPRAVCSQQDSLALADCAFNNAGCQTPVQATCRECAITAKSQPFHGPVIVDDASGALEVNVEGCAALMTNNITANGCGRKLQLMYACEEQACTQCAGTENESCRATARSTTCAPFVADAAPCQTYASQCIIGATPRDVGYSLIRMFCGK